MIYIYVSKSLRSSKYGRYIFSLNFRPDTTQFYDPLLRVKDVVTGRERFFFPRDEQK